MATTEERLTAAMLSHEALRTFLSEELAEKRPDVPGPARDELVEFVMGHVPDDTHSRRMFLGGWAQAHESYMASLN